MTPSMTDLYAGIPVTSLDAALGWNESFVGRPADEVVAGEAIGRSATAPGSSWREQPDRAGGGFLTIGVDGRGCVPEDAVPRGVRRRRHLIT
jgi:hypothetical protein